MDGINKRRYLRVWRARIKISHLVVNKQELKGICKNISAGGILFEAFVPLQEGALVDFQMTLVGFGQFRQAAYDDISGQAKVVRCAKRKTGLEYDIALEFMDLSADIRTHLDNFIRAHKP